VISGWDKGVVGMRVGGRRELIIPPSLGYGPQSPGAGIAANDTLVFVVDLLKVG
jgi:peptidylprolyl isomerase